jgi:hypothetical protein
MSDELRDRYRTLLRCYPATYRAERGDEIVETYLDLATPGHDRDGEPTAVADLGCCGGVSRDRGVDSGDRATGDVMAAKPAVARPGRRLPHLRPLTG